MKNTELICENCGVENLVEFLDSIDPITFDTIEGLETGFFTCWNCSTSFALERRKSFNGKHNKPEIIAHS